MLGAVLATSNSKVALTCSKLTLHMVRLDPCNWVDLTPKIGGRNKRLFVGLIGTLAISKLESFLLA